MVTPALPSPRSLPKEMRSTLDSILERRSGPPTQRGASSIRRPSVPVIEDRAEDDEDVEVPHAPSTTHSAAADKNNFRLDLDFENLRFSCGDVLSAMNAAGESALARRSAVVRNRAAEDSFARTTSRPQSPWESDYVMVSNMMSLDEEDDDAGDGFLVNVDSGLELARPRPQSPLGRAPQAWRHAMYISKLVWPAQEFQTIKNVYRNKPLPPVIPPPKSRWAEAAMLVRKLSLKRS
ncbi:hypothetical protein GSI_04865 [Ganoderma sinense ZZ0214-1]|uniref:Uncharacterized protein n=1 Tax=Ganoderma sinense ZZ0214-1 TaxID=1077348 RepID=A0A2G8SG49_9APHY|nr:hypothetical protein GSI_04865 [Ganoderma sinense ZZ0214-1]